MDRKNNDPGADGHDQAKDIEALLQDIEAHGVAIIGRNALCRKLNASEDWRLDFIFWARGGVAVGMAHIYEGPKAERREREKRIRETMFEHGFQEWSADMYIRMISNPTIMAKAYSMGVVSLEQMQTVEKKSILKKLGDWLTGWRKPVDDRPGARMITKMAKVQRFGSRHALASVSTATILGSNLAADGLEGYMMNNHDNSDPARYYAEKMHNDDIERDMDACMALADKSLHDFYETSSMNSSDSFDDAFGTELWSSGSSFDDFSSSSSSSFSSDDFGSGSMSGSGSFGPDW